MKETPRDRRERETENKYNKKKKLLFTISENVCFSLTALIGDNDQNMRLFVFLCKGRDARCLLRGSLCSFAYQSGSEKFVAVLAVVVVGCFSF
ncbi:hypothetical protein CEXT_168591 [Caerostris extrusa]|uniref:Transmembrane protein n=1 Tax=Caerostris extrusa TaxID=172846 RepID=A0AAV4X568_CAEEX|nr:hypothetical protein CEXT_168591 [Caerostris extrusa]